MSEPDLSHPSLPEALGVFPLRERLAQSLIAVRGAEDVPPSRTGLSSLRLLDPRLSVPLWLGRFPVPRRAVLTILFNHRQTPTHLGWSVERTQVEDFRGRKLTYNSHNGTDFAIPVGTPVLAPAPAVVARVYAEYNRGGHKVVLDHGEGLMTCSAHLARVLVREGDVLRRGQPFAVSGYSGLDALITFPWGIPHVHFNVWLDGAPVDPFARRGRDEASLWLGALPTPVTDAQAQADEPFAPSEFDEAAVEAVVARCKTAAVRDRLRALPTLAARGNYTVCERNYYPTRFPDERSVYTATHARRERLSMPFGADRFDGVVFADER